MGIETRLLMGNEAIALGALRAGVRVVTGYPGTPSTEILETVASHKDKDVYIEWSVNEKSALEVAAGAAYSGARAMVTMKQVGLNVASDPLMSLNYVGVKGGMVVVVADDPGPISSQTEQDTRHFGIFAKLMVFDPSTPEEAYLMIADAFDYSEKYGRPVLFRPTTRVCHGYASVNILPPLEKKEPEGFSKDGGRFVIFPRLTAQNHKIIERLLEELRDDFSRYDKNILTGAASGVKKGIATGGVSYAYVREALSEIDEPCKLLKVSTIPFPEKLALDFLEGLNEVLVIEELDPVIERELIALCGRRHISLTIKGKLTGHTPDAGENTVQGVREMLCGFFDIHMEVVPMSPGQNPPLLPARPPVLCAGCPHRGAFFAVKQAVNRFAGGRKAVFSGDIGCYTLGNAQPLDMVDTCLCMGAGITIAQGINRVEPDTLNFAFIGDSTFFHTGLPGLINAVYNEANIIICILDNATTAMTGNQPHPGMGVTVTGKTAPRLSIYDIVKAAGVSDIARVNPFDVPAATEAVKGMLDKTGVRVLLFEGPCIAVSRGGVPCEINSYKCTGCRVCVKNLGCPVMYMENGKAVIDSVLCTGCGECVSLCRFNAIEGGKAHV